MQFVIPSFSRLTTKKQESRKGNQMKQDLCKKYLEAHNNLVIKSTEVKKEVTLFTISCSSFVWRKLRADGIYFVSHGDGFNPYVYTVQCAN